MTFRFPQFVPTPLSQVPRDSPDGFVMAWRFASCICSPSPHLQCTCALSWLLTLRDLQRQGYSERVSRGHRANAGGRLWTIRSLRSRSKRTYLQTEWDESRAIQICRTYDRSIYFVNHRGWSCALHEMSLHVVSQDLMKYDPQQRPTASQTLQYPFFQVITVACVSWSLMYSNGLTELKWSRSNQYWG